MEVLSTNLQTNQSPTIPPQAQSFASSAIHPCYLTVRIFEKNPEVTNLPSTIGDSLATALSAQKIATTLNQAVYGDNGKGYLSLLTIILDAKQLDDYGDKLHAFMRGNQNGARHRHALTTFCAIFDFHFTVSTDYFLGQVAFATETSSVQLKSFAYLKQFDAAEKVGLGVRTLCNSTKQINVLDDVLNNVAQVEKHEFAQLINLFVTCSNTPLQRQDPALSLLTLHPKSTVHPRVICNTEYRYNDEKPTLGARESAKKAGRECPMFFSGEPLSAFVFAPDKGSTISSMSCTSDHPDQGFYCKVFFYCEQVAIVKEIQGRAPLAVKVIENMDIYDLHAYDHIFLALSYFTQDLDKIKVRGEHCPYKYATPNPPVSFDQAYGGQKPMDKYSYRRNVPNANKGSTNSKSSIKNGSKSTKVDLADVKKGFSFQKKPDQSIPTVPTPMPAPTPQTDIAFDMAENSYNELASMPAEKDVFAYIFDDVYTTQFVDVDVWGRDDERSSCNDFDRIPDEYFTGTPCSLDDLTAMNDLFAQAIQKELLSVNNSL